MRFVVTYRPPHWRWTVCHLCNQLLLFSRTHHPDTHWDHQTILVLMLAVVFSLSCRPTMTTAQPPSFLTTKTGRVGCRHVSSHPSCCRVRTTSLPSSLRNNVGLSLSSCSSISPLPDTAFRQSGEMFCGMALLHISKYLPCWNWYLWSVLVLNVSCKITSPLGP